MTITHDGENYYIQLDGVVVAGPYQLRASAERAEQRQQTIELATDILPTPVHKVFSTSTVPDGRHVLTIREFTNVIVQHERVVEVHFTNTWRHPFYIERQDYATGDIARGALRQIVNVAMQGMSMPERVTGENLEVLMRAAVGADVVYDLKIKQRGGRVYRDPVFIAGMQSPAVAVLRRLEWGLADPEQTMGEAERAMEECDRSGDHSWADGWARVVQVSQEMMRRGR